MKVSHLLAAVAILGLMGFSTAYAKGHKGNKGNKASASLHGKVTAVDASAKTITVKTRGKKGESVTVTTDDNTAITVDGNSATLADIKEGMYVFVTPKEGTATKIVAKTAKAHKRKKGGDQ